MEKKNEEEDMVMQDEQEKQMAPMKLPEVTNEELIDIMEKISNNKSAGPNFLRGEIYKLIGKGKIWLETMARCFYKGIKSNTVPERWKASRTKLIPKKRKPTIRDFRPISVTDVVYKIFMTVIKNRIEEHLEKNHLIKENQTGFTKGGKKEENLFILQYLVGKAFKRKKTLIVITIDYSKAYDSIDRNKMIQALKEYKIHPDIINTIANLYKGDYTMVKIGGKERKIGMTNGIKQGCTASTTLFKIITYEIIKELEEKGRGFTVDNITLESLFFADDSFILADSIEDATHNLNILIEASKKFGLKINREKCNVIVFNDKENTIKEIENIKVVDKIKYLGIVIDNKKDLFKTQKGIIKEQAEKYARLTNEIIHKCVNKMLIGKTYWKNVVIPSILQGIGIITFTKKEINELQRIENEVYRKILDAKSYTPISTLRGDVGSSRMRTRFIESKLVLIKGILTGKNTLTREILHKTREEKGNKWNKQLEEYLKEIKMNYMEINTMTKAKIKTRMKQWDTEEWKTDLESKSSAKIYRTFKTEIKEEKSYDNRFSSALLFRARSNTLELNTRNRYKNLDTKCDLCDNENEDLIHFLIDCKNLEHLRDERIMVKCLDENKEQMVGKILFEYEEIEQTKNMVEKMWNFRKGKQKEKENSQVETDSHRQAPTLAHADEVHA